MCGIIGGWWQVKPENLESLIEKSIGSIAHRGPDDKGIEIRQETYGTLFIGQTRLSIIDLSQGGHQPKSTSNGRFTVTFNGEIYNYREIRKELMRLGYTFHSESDTEVLLSAWEEWGSTCLTKFIGMFSFVIVDNIMKTLTLVRDAFGIKPLFYSFEGDVLCFASEIQAVMYLRNKKAQVNNQRVYDYLIYAVQDIGKDSFVEGIHHVPPSHMVILNLQDGNIDMHQWWNPSIHQNKDISLKHAVEKMRDLFLESIKLHLRSDVPIGIALSGGIDSSAIACATRYVEPNIDINTFSFIPQGSTLSEESWIDIVNNHVNAIPHKAIVKSNELGNDINDLIRVQGEPFCTTSMYAQYRVFELASKAGIKVVLEGQGADELLAGYQGYHGQRMRSLFENADISGMFHFAKEWKGWEGRSHLSPWRAFIGQIISDRTYNVAQSVWGEQNIPNWINKHFLNTAQISRLPVRMKRAKSGYGRRVAEVLYDAMVNNGLPSLLRYGDRNAMRFSIENRVPFLTIQMAEFALSLPEEFLISQNGETKSVFRAAMRGIVPDVILDRRDKIGFEVPMGKWVYEMKNKIKEIELQQEDLSILKFGQVKNLLSENIHNQEKMPLQHWRMINLMLWYKEMLKKYNQSI